MDNYDLVIRRTIKDMRRTEDVSLREALVSGGAMSMTAGPTSWTLRAE